MLPKIKRILYATDLNENGSKNAFRMAVSLAQCHGAQLIFTHAIEPISTYAESMMRNTLSDSEYETLREENFKTLRAQIQERIDNFCRQECAETDMKYPAGEPIIVAEVGEPDEVILSNVKKYDADMVVMGTRTHTGIGQVLLGSTANKIIHHSHVPVMVYPL